VTTGTVAWPVPRPPAGAAGGEGAGGEGLRERKKRLTRQQLADTATAMFLERGFDQVRVTEIADACGVSEKTVFNYFPTKEALVLDRLDSTLTALPQALADPATPPVQAALAVLDEELTALTSWLAGHDDPRQATGQFLRLAELIHSTPSLRAYQHDATDRLGRAAAQALAERAGLHPGDPEPQIAAAALLGLWAVQFTSLRGHLARSPTPEDLHRRVTADVHRAAHLLSTGIGTC
jgi:AcrR family transcriptional regulator